MLRGERYYGIKSGAVKELWEETQFPLACEPCLGENPYLRMLKEKHGRDCRMCQRPFTLFKWKPHKQHYKRTEICAVCAKKKNVCQACLYDLEFHLPMGVRDRRIGENGKQDKLEKPSLPNQPPPDQPIPRLVFIPQDEQPLLQSDSESEGAGKT